MFFLDERYLALVPCLCVVYWLGRGTFRNWILLVFNIAWLAVFSLATAVALTAVTLAFVYPVAWYGNRLREAFPERARRIAWFGVAGVIAIASVLRLRGYILPALNLSDPDRIARLLQWIGFSYFVLKCIYVLTAIARGIVAMPGPVQLLQYVLFLPTITSGPIYRLDTFTEQLAAPKRLSTALIHDGAARVVIGMAKKVVAVPFLSSGFAMLYARGIAFKPPAFVLLYVVLYLDFSGYTDIAIGIGRMLGFDVPENFKDPFRATTLTQFWRNWHATLGDWLRENVFIPMGGVRATGWRLSFIVLASMFVIGLWHAFALRFILWGLYHGTLLLIENRLNVKPLRRHRTKWWQLGLRYAIVQAFVIGGMFAFVGGVG